METKVEMFMMVALRSPALKLCDIPLLPPWWPRTSRPGVISVPAVPPLTHFDGAPAG